MEHILVTGGLGFIGVNLISQLTEQADVIVHNVDSLSLGVTPFDSLIDAEKRARICTYIEDVANSELIASILEKHDIRKVYHLAAESHVDRSITDPQAFFQSNVMGTVAIVEACRRHIEAYGLEDFRFLHVSTDEVFGDLGPSDPPFDKDSAYHPSSPYSASKAASDFVVTSWHRTYGFPGIVTNCSNNFGPGQHTEKLIPTIIKALDSGASIPLYGDGSNVRDWLFVGTHVEYLITIMEKALPGERFLIGGDMELSNLQLCRAVHELFCVRNPKRASRFEDSFTFVADRKGHDRRYAIDCAPLQRRFPEVKGQNFMATLELTIAYYLDHHID